MRIMEHNSPPADRSNYEEMISSKEEPRRRLNSTKKSRFPKLLKVNKMAAVKLSRPENDATQAQWACISKPEAKLGKTLYDAMPQAPYRACANGKFHLQAFKCACLGFFQSLAI